MNIAGSVLIIDDRSAFREDLAYIFRQEFPGIRIDGAEDNELAGQPAPSRDGGPDYDALIIGMRNSDFDPAWHTRPGNHEPLRSLPLDDRLVLFFLLAHPDHPDVLEARQVAGEQMTRTVECPRQVFLPGAEPDWVDLLLANLRKILHPRRVSAKLAITSQFLIPKPPWSRNDSGPRSRATAISDPYYELVDLMRDIETHWDYLKGTLQEEIGRYFNIEKRGTGVIVTLP